MFWDTVKSMENKSTSSQLPTALRLGNTVTTDKSMIISISISQWLMPSSWLLQPRPTAPLLFKVGDTLRPKLLQTYI